LWSQIKGEPLKLERLETNSEFISNDNKVIFLEKGTVVLKNYDNEIINVFGLFNLYPIDKKIENLYIEATFYDIQKNNLKLTTINTKLSYRYLRRIFLETFKYSLQRFLTLVELLTNIKINPIKYSSDQNSQNVKKNKIILLTKSSAKKVLNIEKYNLDIFKQTGSNLVCETTNELYFSIPLSRKDLEREIDIIEEYSRFIGYKNFQIIIPEKDRVYYKQKQKNEQLIKQFFVNYGFNEIVL
jgi:phenylalanyl-tRNA synthetase beta subunit